MPKEAKKKAKKAVEVPEITKLRLQLAGYAGLISRISSFHNLEGDTGDDRFESVVQFFKNKEEERRNRPPAF